MIVNLKDGAMKWSGWYPLTVDELDHHEQVHSGVYRIALCDSYLKYRKNDSGPIHWGSAHPDTNRMLKDRLRGKGNQGVYQRYKHSERMRWQTLITDDIENNVDRALQEFLAAFGRLPVGNASAAGTTAQ